MKYLVLSLFLLSVSTFAADAKKDTHKTLDIESPKSQKDEVTEDTALLMKAEDVKVHITCKEKDGHEIKHGEKGYEACLKKSKKGKSSDIDVKFEK